MNMRELKVALLTISDRCSNGLTEDVSGKNLCGYFSNALNVPHRNITTKILPDDIFLISRTLEILCDEDNVDLIVTTGGTGLATRDVTPEATKMVIDKEAPGISTLMLTESLKLTPMAALSRLVCGIRKNTLIINFPGSPTACNQCLSIVQPVLNHALDVLKNNEDANMLHVKIIGDEESVTSKVTIDKISCRNRKSPYPMIPVKEAQDIILKNVEKLEQIIIKTTNAAGYRVNSAICASEPFPPFRASMKDGYAVISSDGIGIRRVISFSLAGCNGASNFYLKPGECMRITTGAAVPNGADSVVQVEDTDLVEEDELGAEILIEILKSSCPGQDIREVGSDIPKDSILVSSGTLLTSSDLGVLATARVQEVLVTRKPTIAILSTGNELQPLHTRYQFGKIIDSNKITLMSLLEENGFKAIDCGIAIDEPDSLLKSIKSALNANDILITTGGVSMGERDLVTDVLIKDFGAKLHFGRVNMKPGKPTKFFQISGNEFFLKSKYVIALPGNPVSAAVTCHLFVLPALKKMSGDLNPLPLLIKVVLSSEVTLDERQEFARARIDWNLDSVSYLPVVTLTGNQISSRMMNMIRADCLLHLPSATQSVKKLSSGEIVDAQLLNFH